LDPNGIIANATENPLNLDGDDASLLDEFFAEIESLKIHDENDDEEEEDGNHQVESEKDGRNTGIIEHPRSLCGRSSRQKEKEQHQKSMIDRAESTKDNWKTFTIAETSQPQSISVTPKRSSLTANGRKPISFSLGVGVGTESTKKKKKKKQNTQSKITRRQRQETESGQPCLGFGFDDETSSSTSPSPSLSPSPSPRRRDPPTPLSHPNHHLLPQWIAVLDTCAILESYESVCAMILLAKEAAAATGADSSHFLHQHPASRAFVSEALTIVVPYTVWDELDYRSKEIDDEHQRYKARRAARMLTEELRREQQQENAADRHHQYHQSQTQTHPIGELWFERDSIRSQSRIESHRAVEEFVLLLTSSPSSKAAASMDGIANNDDKILACALYEQNRLMKARSNTNVNSNATEPNDDATTIRRRAATAGGVVLITSDKVLTGKARADRLSVYSSSEFVRYYNKRMASLRSRASATSRGAGDV
jgi:rRNA-processing protein FCF1